MKKIMISALAVALIAGFGTMFGQNNATYRVESSGVVCTDYSLAKAKGRAITNTAGVPLGHWYTLQENGMKETAGQQGKELLFAGQHRMGNKLCRVYHMLSSKFESSQATRTQLIEEKKRIEAKKNK